MFDKIEKYQYWDQGWKLVEGCTTVSEACLNCWSLGMERRFRKETGVVFHPERLEKPFKFKKPTSFAIWNDLFHESVPCEWIDKVFEVMFECEQHTFQILTKRPENLLKYIKAYEDWQPELVENIWFGVTAENQKTADERIPILLKIPAKVRFVSCEPLLSEISLNEYYFKKANGNYPFPYIPEKDRTKYINLINWVIAGRETGHGAREMKIEWLQSLYQQCKYAGVPFFDKRNKLGLNIQEYPIK